ncbi:MAG TPA: hypothetical protein VFZ53_28555 [Polyangiaceae bacterium]
MNRPRSRGFVLGEVAMLLAGLTVLTALGRALEPSVDRFCVGAGATPNGARPPRAVSDVRRWVCVAIPNDEAPENQYAASGAGRSRVVAPATDR